MSEIVTSILNKKSLMYGSGDAKKNFGPDCVDGKGEEVKGVEASQQMHRLKLLGRNKKYEF